MKKIIFVCTGNTCRSPMAEAMARELFCSLEYDIQVLSRGISVYGPSEASEQAKQMMQSWGLDLSGHLAKPLCITDLEGTDLILTMTAAQKKVLQSACQSAGIEIKTLKEFAGKTPADILDPFGQGLEVYRQCAKEIAACLEKIPEVLRLRLEK